MEEEAGSPIGSGMTKKRRAPRWTIPFLRALERTGDARASAEDAGIDHTTAYARRRAHPEFAAAWEEAIAAHAAGAEREKAEELERLRRAAPPRSGELSCPSPKAEGKPKAQLKRAGHDRWSPRKEKAFFDELAATANVKRAAKAAGVSPNAVYQRRLRDAHFRAKWAAVLETGRASIEMHLVEAANRSFEPEELDVDGIDVTLGNRPPDGRAGPVVSVAEAIRIVQVHGSKTQREMLPNPFAEQAASMSEDDVQALRERVLNKIRRLTDRTRREQLEAGWTHDERHDVMIPPGWTKAPDYKAREPEEPDGFDALSE
jgi:hypothetical protein